MGNGIAPPLAVRRHDGAVLADATLDLAYEGPPSHLHGGMSALVMDQLPADRDESVEGIPPSPWREAWTSTPVRGMLDRTNRTAEARRCEAVRAPSHCRDTAPCRPTRAPIHETLGADL